MRDLVKESKSESAKGLHEGSKVVEKFWPNFGAKTAENWRREKSGKIGNAEYESILRRCRAYC